MLEEIDETPSLLLSRSVHTEERGRQAPLGKGRVKDGTATVR